MCLSLLVTLVHSFLSHVGAFKCGSCTVHSLALPCRPLPRCFNFPPRLVHPRFTALLTRACLAATGLPLASRGGAHVTLTKVHRNVLSLYQYADVFSLKKVSACLEKPMRVHLIHFSFYPEKNKERERKNSEKRWNDTENEEVLAMTVKQGA